VHDPQHFDVEWQVQKSGAWAASDLQHCAAQRPRLAVNYAPSYAPNARPGMFSAIVRAFVESKPTL
jgi:hypothetical protein